MDTLPSFRFVTGSSQANYPKPTPLGPQLEIRGRVGEIKGRKGRKGSIESSVLADDVVTVRGEVVALRMPDDFGREPRLLATGGTLLMSPGDGRTTWRVEMKSGVVFELVGRRPQVNESVTDTQRSDPDRAAPLVGRSMIPGDKFRNHVYHGGG